MAEISQEVITAICDVPQESFIASSLTRLGLKVVHRATSQFGLTGSLEDFPTAIIIRSEDFKYDHASTANTIITIAASRKSQQSGRYSSPSSDLELQELLHSSREREGARNERPLLCKTQVTSIAGIRAGVGVTTLAINYAQEITSSGFSVLLLDCNLQSPQISTHFDLNRINRSIQPTRFGFSIGEPSSIEVLLEMNEAASSFDRVVIDLGKFQSHRSSMAGRRCEDVINSWALQSTAQVILLGRSSEDSMRACASAKLNLQQAPLALDPLFGITLDSALSRGERKSLALAMEAVAGSRPFFLSRDFRSIALAERAHSTLQEMAAKSILRNEIKAQIPALT